LVAIRDEKHQNFKAQGDTERSYQSDPIKDALVNYGNKLNKLNADLKEQREINRMNKFTKDSL
jgi:hypothetical protein